MKNIIAISGKIGSGKDTVGHIITYLTSVNTHIPYLEWKGSEYEYPGCSDWEIKKFATKLKQMVALLTGCTVEDLESQEFKTKQLGKEWDYHASLATDSEGRSVFCRLACNDDEKYPYPHVRKSQTYREILQRVGTEAMRNQIHENVWVNALFADYKHKPDEIVLGRINPKDFMYPKWIITDARFPNEAAAIKKHGGIIIRTKRTQFLKGNSLGMHAHPSETSLDDYKFDYVIDNEGTLEELVEKVREILIKEKILK